jgi:DNA-binding winged helix-turn-helix (wHTH) protein/TolB-like protein
VNRVRFGAFEADVQSRELWRDGVVVPLQDLPFRLLAILLERPGQVVSRDELAERLWGRETFVDAGAGVNTAIAKLREALGDTAEAPRFIETVPRRGHRFVGEVAPVVPADAAPRRFGGRTVLAVGWLATVLMVLLAVALVATRRSPERVAVVLFDNETGLAEWDRRAQGLTDATVAALTRLADLEVIGNAAVLRTARPFRDIEKIRDALRVDFVIVGQVQRVDQATVVRCHLIRAGDQAHVWFDTVQSEGSEAQLQADVGARFAAAVQLNRRDH